MAEIIDLSQEIYEGMPVYKSLPQVKMSVHNTHEEWNNIKNPTTSTPAVYKLELGEHTGTHVDALNHMAREHEGKSIDTMPLSMFYTEGICVDFSHKKFQELITSEDIQEALKKDNITIKKMILF
ncbi:putative cyclase [Tenacibaculum adriaticum]|uniref:Putative cyclase n=1 Tax=Tenacibaculum adriaticum TaxID=413713 RepID=A0A5S5DXJ6_9FLAO|nr:cyclase family protein [Tenacibaculum adriaticum]TYP99329.1 putative cyclase [Tenacibaculum adriaticum]